MCGAASTELAVPFCEDCSRYWAPSTMTVDGRCPTCDRQLDAPGDGEAQDRRDHGDERAPWHFKLLVAAVVVYLGWRFFQIFFS
ncbi:MAG: hypothetical protein ACRDZ2_02365 [Ilumatobacteraceae bacterium]